MIAVLALTGSTLAACGADDADTTAVAEFDKAQEHMTHLADTLAQGIVAQFPDKV